VLLLAAVFSLVVVACRIPALGCVPLSTCRLVVGPREKVEFVSLGLEQDYEYTAWDRAKPPRSCPQRPFYFSSSHATAWQRQYDIVIQGSRPSARELDALHTSWLAWMQHELSANWGCTVPRQCGQTFALRQTTPLAELEARKAAVGPLQVNRALLWCIQMWNNILHCTVQHAPRADTVRGWGHTMWLFCFVFCSGAQGYQSSSTASKQTCVIDPLSVRRGGFSESPLRGSRSSNSRLHRVASPSTGE
jgi:hypothetical protein